MTLASRLAAANIDRTTQRQGLESLPPEEPGIVSGVPVADDANGVTVETENGGRITIPRENDAAEGITPSQGRPYQLSVNGSSARLQVNSRNQSQPQPTPQQTGRVFWDTVPPVTGQDFGQPGDVWAYMQGAIAGYDRVSFWQWAQPLGRFVPMGAAEESNGQIKSPTANQVVNIITRANYRSVVASVAFEIIGGASFSNETTAENSVTGASTTLTLSTAIGGVVEVGEKLSLTVTATSGSAFSWTVGYMKL